MMKKSAFLNLWLAASLVAPAAMAQTKRRQPQPVQKKVARPTTTATRKPRPLAPPTASINAQVQRALDTGRSGNYQAASANLFSLGRRTTNPSDRAVVKYYLGVMLMEMKLNQVAAFQFVDVIRLNVPKYTKMAVEKLSIVADGLGDDTLLNYAVNRLDVSDIAPGNRDMIYFRIGEVKLKNKDYRGAEAAFSRVQQGGSYYNQALYNRGLALMELNRLDDAITMFNGLISVRSRASVTDTNRVAAMLGIARALYQKGDWDAATEAYSRIPRDHFLWHEALFEQTWSMLRAARFRSSLSNFQSLHSAYYEDFYIPESLLLRAIVYLYICKYDEMEKVLQLFEKTYGPTSAKVRDFLRLNNEPMAYYQEIEKGAMVKKGRETSGNRLPYIVLKHVLEKGDVRRSFNYLRALDEEKAKIDANPSFRSSAVGGYALKIVASRKRATHLAIGDMVKAHLKNMRTELADLYEQAGFIRYEMINGKKEVMKKRMSGRDLPEQTVDEDLERSFYVQNGYEYYPFQGENWLDEIGNYHYLGKSSCE